MLVDCLMQVYRIGFLVTSLPVNCNGWSKGKEPRPPAKVPKCVLSGKGCGISKTGSGRTEPFSCDFYAFFSGLIFSLRSLKPVFPYLCILNPERSKILICHIPEIRLYDPRYAIMRYQKKSRIRYSSHII